jgi:2-hydroxychromene-2-carboxylate isomerase
MIEFHFDFLSPYGYFASRFVESLAEKHGRQLDWRPMLLGVSVMKVMGLKPLTATPLKGDYVRLDVARTARRLGLGIGRDLNKPPPSSLVPARALCWVKKNRPQASAGLVHSVYAAMWREGKDLNAPTDLTGLALPPDLPVDELVGAAASTEAAELLRQEVARSLGEGVFGSPTFVVDGEPFWGFDRMAHVDEWLSERR